MTAALTPRKAAIKAFAFEFRKATTARGLTWESLSRVVGIGSRQLSYYGDGTALPHQEDWERLADVLDNYDLLPLLKEAATKLCVNPNCQQPFVPRRKHARYCSPTCSVAVRKRRKGIDVRNRADDAERALAEAKTEIQQFTEAVAAFCGDCEPDGVCRMAACHMRDFSPLPLLAAEPRVIKPLHLRDREPARPQRRAS